MSARIRLRAFLAVLVVVGTLGGVGRPAGNPATVVIQGAGDRQAALVEPAGGTVLARFAHVDMLKASVPSGRLAELERAGLRVTLDQQLVASSYDEPAADAATLAAPQLGGGAPPLTYPSLATGAARLHGLGIDGTGVTVAIIDSGMPSI